jgi:hypothetical protein
VLKFYLVPPEGLWELLGALSEIWGRLLSDRRIKGKVQLDAISFVENGVYYGSLGYHSMNTIGFSAVEPVHI